MKVEDKIRDIAANIERCFCGKRPKVFESPEQGYSLVVKCCEEKMFHSDALVSDILHDWRERVALLDTKNSADDKVVPIKPTNPDPLPHIITLAEELMEKQGFTPTHAVLVMVDDADDKFATAIIPSEGLGQIGQFTLLGVAQHNTTKML